MSESGSRASFKPRMPRIISRAALWSAATWRRFLECPLITKRKVKAGTWFGVAVLVASTSSVGERAVACAVPAQCFSNGRHVACKVAVGDNGLQRFTNRHECDIHARSRKATGIRPLGSTA